MYDWNFPRSLNSQNYLSLTGITGHAAPNPAHYGAVTVLSLQMYGGFDLGGTGNIEVTGNEIYNMPQAFFFKNPMVGPVTIQDNTIHDCNYFGIFCTPTSTSLTISSG